MEKILITSESEIKRIVQQAVNDALGTHSTEKVVEEKPERLLTTIEATEFLRCSKPTLHRWKKEGLIPFIRIGANIRYKESELQKLLEKKGV